MRRASSRRRRITRRRGPGFTPKPITNIGRLKVARVPRKPFRHDQYFLYAFATMKLRRITWWEKSRDLMLSWACVAYLTLEAMKTPYCGILFQTQKDKKVIQLVDYAKVLYGNSDPRIRDAYPLSKPLERQADHELNFANGSYIIGIPGGADQIRSYHPWGYLNDESSFQADAGECYNEALSAVKGKIIFNSSAGPGWYADARRDIVRERRKKLIFRNRRGGGGAPGRGHSGAAHPRASGKSLKRK